jgi:hypothetical protein
MPAGFKPQWLVLGLVLGWFWNEEWPELGVAVGFSRKRYGVVPKTRNVRCGSVHWTSTLL